MAHPSGVYNSVILFVCKPDTYWRAMMSVLWCTSATSVPGVPYWSSTTTCWMLKLWINSSLVLYRPLEPVLALGNNRFSNDREARTLWQAIFLDCSMYCMASDMAFTFTWVLSGILDHLKINNPPFSVAAWLPRLWAYYQEIMVCDWGWKCGCGLVGRLN